MKNNVEIRIQDILEAKKKYRMQLNISKFLRNKLKLNENTSEIIEVVYDLQAGKYNADYKINPVERSKYSKELASIIDKNISNSNTLLDVGCGELTTISLILKELNKKPKNLFVFDISWSRIFKGLDFANEILLHEDYLKLIPFVSDITEIPLKDKSIDVTTSSYALYSSHGRLKLLMSELFRVTKDKLLLFEPCYEMASPLGRKRMDELKYIRNVKKTIVELGGTLAETLVIQNNTNPLTPTVCYVIYPPQRKVKDSSYKKNSSNFTIPGTNYPLTQLDNFYVSIDTGICFPILKSIPIFRNKSAILASALIT